MVATTAPTRPTRPQRAAGQAAGRLWGVSGGLLSAAAASIDEPESEGLSAGEERCCTASPASCVLGVEGPAAEPAEPLSSLLRAELAQGKHSVATSWVPETWSGVVVGVAGGAAAAARCKGAATEADAPAVMVIVPTFLTFFLAPVLDLMAAGAASAGPETVRAAGEAAGAAAVGSSTCWTGWEALRAARRSPPHARRPGRGAAWCCEATAQRGRRGRQRPPLPRELQQGPRQGPRSSPPWCSCA
jgi:hypothetical protein